METKVDTSGWRQADDDHAIFVRDGEGIVAVFCGSSAQKHSAHVLRCVQGHDAMEAALLAALPFVEEAESDKGYKPGVVARVVKQIKAALSSARPGSAEGEVGR